VNGFEHKIAPACPANQGMKWIPCRLVGAVACGFALQACGPSQDEINDIRQRAHDLAVEDAAAALGRSDFVSTFGAAACAPNCAARTAGFKWAAQNDISEAKDCDDGSVVFRAGCRAFADEVERRGKEAAAKAY